MTGIVRRHRAALWLARRIHELDDKKGTFAAFGAGPMALTGEEWIELLRLANEIDPPDDCPF